MEDTDTASSAVDGMEMMNVGEPGAQEPQRSSEVGGDHEERGETPKRMALVTHELEKLRMSVYAEKFERHGFDHWPCVLLSALWLEHAMPRPTIANVPHARVP